MINQTKPQRKLYNITVTIPCYANSKEEAEGIIRRELRHKFGSMFEFYIKWK